jgi:hypothetical protein
MANVILILKERDTMQIHRAKPKLLLLTGLSILLTGCSISDWYNGYYAETASIRRVHKERNAYYEAESPEMKELRKTNQTYCSDLASRPENRVARKGYKNGVSNTPMYTSCMERRSTPTFETYKSMQAEKRRVERRARGKCIGSCYSHSSYNGHYYLDAYLKDLDGNDCIDKNTGKPISNPEFDIILEAL